MPVLYLDIDGTVRHGVDELGYFVNKPEHVVLFDGVPELLARYREHGWRIVGISNQGGVALGHVTKEAVQNAMTRTQHLSGSAFDKIAWCPHHPTDPDPEMAVCWCRKPRAGLVVEAAIALSMQHMRRGYFTETYPPYLALFVGDRAEDEGCAEAANIQFMPAEEWRTGAHANEVLR